MNREYQNALDKVVLELQKKLWIESRGDNSRQIKASAHKEDIDSINENFKEKYSTCYILTLKKWDESRGKPYRKK